MCIERGEGRERGGVLTFRAQKTESVMKGGGVRQARQTSVYELLERGGSVSLRSSEGAKSDEGQRGARRDLAAQQAQGSKAKASSGNACAAGRPQK